MSSGRRLSLRKLETLRADCESCDGLAVLLVKKYRSYQFLCADCYNRSMSVRYLIREVYVLRGTQIRDMDPVLHKQVAYWWGRIMPEEVCSFIGNEPIA